MMMQPIMVMVFLTTFITWVISFDQCLQTAEERVRCPIRRTGEACKDRGCYLCRGPAKPRCIEGIACKRVGLTYRDNCWDESGDPTPKECIAKYGCSWCSNNPVYKCVHDTPIPSLPSENNCVLNDRLQCAANENQTKCENRGCHYCSTSTHLCVFGGACKKVPTADENCWQGLGDPKAADCKLLYGCSWCPENPFIKCVRDYAIVPAPPTPPRVDHCVQPNSERRGCNARLNSTLCLHKGCYFCSSGSPKCIEGIACRKTPTNLDNCWPEDAFGEPNSRACRELYGCSWCKYNKDIKCVRDFQGPLTQPRPVNNCAQVNDDRIGCNARRNETVCRNKGCHYCYSGRPRCIEGLACKRTGLTRLDNCWPEGAGEPNAKDCMEIYRCSWCKDNSKIKCVRDTPLAPVNCDVPESSLQCFPFDTVDITQSQCEANIGCKFCGEAAENKYKCMTSECPSGWRKRYQTSSCCKPKNGAARIVGGVEADLGRWPWMAQILKDGIHECGGSLVGPNLVISAAHCNTRYAHLHQVLFGAVDVTDPHAVIRNVTEEFLYGWGNPKSEDNDIKLIKLDDVVVCSPKIQPIDLPHQEQPLTGQRCFVTGWGATTSVLDDQVAQRFLREVGVDILDFQRCVDVFQFDNGVTPDEDSKICSGIITGGKDSCQGDSGGPLVCQRCKNCDWYLAGIVSYGYGCGEPYLPPIYTRVSHYESRLVGNGVPTSDETFNCDMY